MMNKSFIFTSKNQKTTEFKETLFGSLLGDDSLEMSSRELNTRFDFVQSLGKKDYFKFLVKISFGKYREYSYLNKRSSKTYTSLKF